MIIYDTLKLNVVSVGQLGAFLLTVTGSPQKWQQPMSKLLMAFRKEETIRWRGREAGAGRQGGGGG